MKTSMSLSVVLFSFILSSFLSFAQEYRPVGELTAGEGVALRPLSKIIVVRQGIPSGPYMVEIVPTYGPRIGAPGRSQFVSRVIGGLTGTLGALSPVSKINLTNMVAGAGFDSQLNFAFRIVATNGTITASQVTGRIESLDVIFNGSFTILANSSPEVMGKRPDGVWESISSSSAPYTQIVGLGPAGNFRITTTGEIAQIAGYISRQDIDDYQVIGSVNGVEAMVSTKGFPQDPRVAVMPDHLMSLSVNTGHWAAVQMSSALGQTNWVNVGVIRSGGKFTPDQSFPGGQQRFYRLWVD
jgi:hypothetical protein